MAQLFSSRINAYYYDVIVKIGINLILAVSLNLINGYTGQFSLGHAGFMSVGAYASAAVTMQLAPKLLPHGAGTVGTVVVFGGGAGDRRIGGGHGRGLGGRAVAAAERGLPGDRDAGVWGNHSRDRAQHRFARGRLGLNGIPAYTNLFWVYAVAFICAYVVLSMVHSSYGRGFLAVRDDEVAAEAMGLNTTRYKIVAFVVGAFFAGVAGGIYGHYTLSIDPKGFDFNRSIEIVVMVIVGGMGNTLGVVAAAYY